MTTFYECRFAPNAATRREVIRNAQVVHDHGIAAYEAFSPDAFKGWGKREIRVLLDHDPKQRAGTVSVIAPHKDWWIGTFILDGPHAARGADWIARCGRLSPGFDPIEMDPDFARAISPAHYPYHWHTRATLNEVSILPPGAFAWFVGARVTRVSESKPAPTVSSARSEVLTRHEVSRRYVGRDLIVDMSDGVQEIYHGVRRERPKSSGADRPAAGEVVYSGRVVRPGIGRVTAVGGVPRPFRFSDAEIRARTELAAASGDPDAVEREIIAMKRLEAAAR